MRIIGVDLHTRQQSLAMLDTETGDLVEKTLEHESEKVQEFYSALTSPVLVGIEPSKKIQSAFHDVGPPSAPHDFVKYQ
jgi:hypothetical protein